jgi:AcrR family transcriptional regulator
VISVGTTPGSRTRRRVDLGAVVEAIGAAAPGRSPALDRVLDAALACFTQRGLRTTTMADVAEAAGVSRVWVHRLVGSRDDLVHAVLTREVERVFEVLATIVPVDPSPDVAFGDAVGVVVAHFAAHPLVRRLVDDEADQVVAAFTDGRFLDLVSDRVATLVGLALGVAPEAVRPVCEGATRVSASLIIAPMTPGGDDPGQVAALVAAAFGPALLAVTDATAGPGRRVLNERSLNS